MGQLRVCANCPHSKLQHRFFTGQRDERKIIAKFAIAATSHRLSLI